MLELLKSKSKLIIFVLVLIVSIGLVSIKLLMNNNSVEVNDNLAYIDTTDISTTSKLNEFYVDVKGAVKSPGVYKANNEMIVDDMIKAAGGITSNGTTSDINLAMKLTDGMVIYVSKKNEIKSSSYTTNKVNYNKNNKTTKFNGLVNINTASKEELMSLNGIGEAKAKAIIEYRSKNPFKSIEDIKNVSGIGDAFFARIKEYITVQ